MKEFVASENIKKGDKFNRQRIRDWFHKNYPKIKMGTVYAHSMLMTINAPSRMHHTIHKDGRDDLFYQLEDGFLRLYDKDKDPTPFYKENKNIEEKDSDESRDITELHQEFAYEKDLRNFLSNNLDIIEKGLTLFDDDGISGIEYDAGGRFIDILAIDNNSDFVVIELKVSKGYDRVVGQLLRYINWVRINLAEKNKRVRGIIIGRIISEDLKIACSQLEDVKLYEYNLEVSLKAI